MADATSTLSTDAVDPADSVDFWTTAISQTYVELGCSVPEGLDRIDGRIDAADIASLSLSRVAGTAQNVVRTPGSITRTSDDFFLVSVQTAGSGLVVQDERTALLHPGDFALYDSTRPYQLHF